MDASGLQGWLERSSLLGRLPEDLVSFWVETGGGDVFETETILGPLGDPALGEDIIEVNRSLHQAGMPEQYLVFHTGLLTSALDTLVGDYVELRGPDFQVVRRFPSLDAWYTSTLREEYGQRYGMP
jgi:hypothetical protein